MVTASITVFRDEIPCKLVLLDKLHGVTFQKAYLLKSIIDYKKNMQLKS